MSSVEAVPACGCATPGAADPSHCYCAVEDLLSIIRRRYSLAVLRAIHSLTQAHPAAGARYHDIAAAVPEASSSTLAETLRALEAARLIHREGSAGPRLPYWLTDSGKRLLSRLRRLLEDVRAS